MFLRLTVFSGLFFLITLQHAESKIRFKGFACFLLLPENSQENKAVPLHYRLKQGQQFQIALRPFTDEPIDLLAFRSFSKSGIFLSEYSYRKKQGYYVFPKKDHYFVYQKSPKKHQLLIVATSKHLQTQKSPTTQIPLAPKTAHKAHLQAPPSLTFLQTPEQARYFRAFAFPMFVIIDIHHIGHGRPHKE